jgi:hypothetical protein
MGLARNRSQHGKALAGDSVTALTKEVSRVDEHVLSLSKLELISE